MFLEALMLEWGVEFEAAGSTTFEREDLDQGFEPDEGYWITQVERLDPERGYDPARPRTGSSRSARTGGFTRFARMKIRPFELSRLVAANAMI